MEHAVFIRNGVAQFKGAGIVGDQRIAAGNEQITAQVYDINHFPALREKYNVMSVPCLVVGDGEVVSFGKKNVRQLLEVLNK